MGRHPRNESNQLYVEKIIVAIQGCQISIWSPFLAKEPIFFYLSALDNIIFEPNRQTLRRQKQPMSEMDEFSKSCRKPEVHIMFFSEVANKEREEREKNYYTEGGKGWDYIIPIW